MNYSIGSWKIERKVGDRSCCSLEQHVGRFQDGLARKENEQANEDLDPSLHANGDANRPYCLAKSAALGVAEDQISFSQNPGQ